jgi:hypothetical protein
VWSGYHGLNTLLSAAPGFEWVASIWHSLED